MNTSIRIDPEQINPGRFKVTIAYHEGDTAQSNGRSADVIVYVGSVGQPLPQAGPLISHKAVAAAREFLQQILDEAK